MMIFSLFLTVRIFITDQNVDKVIEKSYITPVFCVFFSPNCPPCRMMHPSWLQFMSKYAFDPNIIVSECESQTNYKAARKLLSFSTFPTYGLIFKGQGQILNVERTYKGFRSKAEEIKRININNKCNYFNKSHSKLNFPAIVVETKGSEITDCSFLTQLSKISGVKFDHFYLSQMSNTLSEFWNSPTLQKKNIKIYYSKDKSERYSGKRKMNEIASFVKDQIKNPPLYDWNLNFPHRSTRQNVILVYSDIKSIDNFYDFIIEKSDKFSFSKIKFSDFNSSFHFLTLKDLPAMIFPDLKNMSCTLLKNIDLMMNLRVMFDNNRFGNEKHPFKPFHYDLNVFFLIGVSVLVSIYILILAIKKIKLKKTE